MNGRFVALDRLRALAVVLMVQGHTFSALLREGAMTRAAMELHALVHGLTAPAFLFGAGLAFGVARGAADRHLQHTSARSAKRYGRYAAILVLGYLLQLPGGSLRATLQLRSDTLTPVLRVGPLQLIAVCLSACQLLTFLRSRRNHALVCATIGLLVAGLTPTVYSSAIASCAPLLLRPWLDDATGSLFPLFPWASFAFIGVAAAYAVTATSSRASTWLIAGAALTATTYVLYLSGYRLSQPALFWKASPLNMAFRLGLVLCLLGALHLSTFAISSYRQQQSLTRLLARHSLVAYVTHLLLLYGTPFTPSLVRAYGRRLGVLEASAVFALVMLTTLLSTYVWSRLGDREVQEQRWVKVALFACCILVLTR